jgi:hydroxymethylpyrimidine kinase / phosphomethylpyrimidine kinase / thiamine-phosphate diphosphorylase
MQVRIGLSIAGSDSGGAAGIQADLKTLTNLGVYGCTAITAITAQNTKRVSSITVLDGRAVADQINSTIRDIHPNAIKIGMVYNKENIHIIKESLKSIHVPIILDPIFAAGTGARLLLPDALETFKRELIPISTVITPNHSEAEEIVRFRIKSRNDIKKAANRIKDLGAKNVIIKSTHLYKRKITDILLNSESKFLEISNRRLKIAEIHGSGCNFSAAVTAFLARDHIVTNAFVLANKYVQSAIRNNLKVGAGLAVAHPALSLYEDANRYFVLMKLHAASAIVESIDRFGELIPETQSNLVFALPEANKLDDVAAIKGRIVKFGERALCASRIVEFGASRHVASAVLVYIKSNPLVRSAINIKFNKNVERIIKSDFKVSSYDRRLEDSQTSRKEGMSTPWGIKLALAKNPEAELIYHNGSIGKEAMCLIFGEEPSEVVLKATRILKKLTA